MSPIDLHCHSFYSDGILAPAAVVARAAEAGVEVLALTDHDVLDGIAEAQQAASVHAIRLIAGVEISTTWQAQTIHVVGLDVDPEHPALQAGLAKLRERRNLRAAEMAEKLARAGIPGVLEGMQNLAQGKILSRTHAARYLVEAGHAKDFGDAFKRWLKSGRPGAVKSDWTQMGDAVDWIRAAGGQAVIAHPGRYRMTFAKLTRLAQVFRSVGGEGIEVISGSHGPNDVAQIHRLSHKEKLKASVGSDFHDPNAWAQLGKIGHLPKDCTPIWEGWKNLPASLAA
jgi:predicted metal-dependent phosphoesterase TrpH